MTWREDHEAIIEAVRSSPLRVSSRGWKRFDCPLCELLRGKPDRKKTGGYHVVTKRYECFKCGSSGRLKEDPDDYSEFDVDEASAVATIVEPPEGFHLLCSDVGRTSEVLRAAWDYLLGPVAEGCRGLTEAQVEQFGIGACVRGRYAGRVIIPVRNSAGEWLWFVGRVWEKKAEKPYLYPLGGRNGVMFNHAALHVKTDEPAAIVEGSFDAMYLDPDGIAVLGSPSEANMLAFAEAERPLVFVLDGDAHEQAFTYAMRLRLAGKRAGTLKLPPRIDPDEIPLCVLREAMVRSLDCFEVSL